MSEQLSIPESAQPVLETLSVEQQAMAAGIFGALALRESTTTPPLTGAMPKSELLEEVVSNVQETNGQGMFDTMDFHFALEKLALAGAVTIYPNEALVRTGNHPGADPAAVTIPGRRRMTTADIIRTEAYWGISSGCLDRPGPRW